MAHELAHLRENNPAWHIWASAQGRLYATARRMSALLPGASVTVDAVTADGLSLAIAAAERDAGRATDLWERASHGH